MGEGRPSFDLSGGSLALDFANTWEDRSRSETDRLGSYSDLLAFAEQSGILGRSTAQTLAAEASRRPAAAARAVAAARRLRDAHYRLFSSLAAGTKVPAEDLHHIGALAVRAAARLRLEPAGGRFAWRWRDLDSSLEAALGPIARAAADLLTGDELDRVRECDGDRCTWLFLDTSRNRSRRWCSMESCGNRAKARRHYRRSLESGHRGG